MDRQSRWILDSKENALVRVVKVDKKEFECWN